MSELKHTKANAKDIQNLPIIGFPVKGEKEEKYLREIGEYEFLNSETPGLIHEFTYGTKDNKHTFKFFHGGKYKIPRFIAMHVESKGTPMYKWVPDGLGSLKKQLIGNNPRFRMRQIF